MLRTWLPALAMVLLTAAPAAATLTCVVCPRPISVGSYVTYTVEGQTYHAHGEHARLGGCQSCGGLRGPRTAWGQGGRELDGTMLCGRCQASVVRSDARAQAIGDSVRRQMESWGMSFNWAQIPLKLVEQGVLDAKVNARHPGTRTSGVTDSRFKQWTDGRREVTSLRILMRHALPEAEFERTAAHELTHAWMSLQGSPDRAEPAFVEGACNLVAYYYLQTQGTADADRLKKRMLASSDPVYGEGLRRQIRYATAYRVSGLLKILPTATGFPAGY